MSNFNKTLNAFAEKLEKFHISNNHIVHKTGVTARTSPKPASAKTAKSSRKVVKKNSYLRKNKNNTRKTAKKQTGLQKKLEERRRTSAKRRAEEQRAARTRKIRSNVNTTSIIEGRTRAEERKRKTAMPVENESS